MIEVKHLTKRYGNHVAVNDLNFTIDKGKVYGFLGPNGAGKSTTMNIITGCLGATEGEVLIDGHSVAEEPMQAKRLIGYLPEQPPVYMDMTPAEYLDFVARAKGHSGQGTRAADRNRNGKDPHPGRAEPSDPQPVQGLPAAGWHCASAAGTPGSHHSG